MQGKHNKYFESLHSEFVKLLILFQNPFLCNYTLKKIIIETHFMKNQQQ